MFNIKKLLPRILFILVVLFSSLATNELVAYGPPKGAGSSVVGK